MTVSTSAPSGRPGVDQLLTVADAAVGLSAAAARWALRGGRVGSRAVAPVVPVVRRALRPSYVDERFWPESALGAVVERGREERAAVTEALTRLVLALLPEAVDVVLDQVDLTDLVIDRVDLDEVAAHLDVDAVARRIDIQAIIDRIDLIGLAGFIIDGVDLPDIIRGSTGSMASDGIRGVRTQTMDADEWVGRVVDRMLLRRHGRQTETPLSGTASDHGHNGHNGHGPA